jgi:hypothetical protein
MTRFNLIKRIQTETNSIFYSIVEYNGEFLGFARQSALQYYKDSRIKHVKFDKDLNIIRDNILTYIGEDPRVFIHNNSLYIVDNTFNNIQLIHYDTGRRIPIPISGKNLTFISHNNILYFIHYLKPFVLFEYNIDLQTITKKAVSDDGNTYNYEYRGGTSAYVYAFSKDKYYGFGHRTYHKNSVLTHDVFKWIITFSETPSIEIVEVEQPPNSKNICDPTSIINIDNKNYLITAESDTHWFDKQDYVTNIYEILD